MYVLVDAEGRICASTSIEDYSNGMIEFSFPENFDFSEQEDYRIVNDTLIYDPLSDLNPEVSLGDLVHQLAQFASIQMETMDLSKKSSEKLIEFKDLWPNWNPKVDYKQNDQLQYDGKYWRVSRDLTSSKTYPPGTSESLYYEIRLAPDGIIIYRTCHGKYDSVRLGEKRHYPDADGPIYESLVDYNAYSPDAYPKNWKLVE